MSRVKTYTKYYVKRSLDGREARKEEDGSPTLGDVHKTKIRLTPEQAAELNEGWDSREKPLSFFYKEDEVKDDKEYRKELFSKAKEFGLEVAKNIKTEDLELKLKELND